MGLQSVQGQNNLRLINRTKLNTLRNKHTLNYDILSNFKHNLTKLRNRKLPSAMTKTQFMHEYNNNINNRKISSKIPLPTYLYSRTNRFSNPSATATSNPYSSTSSSYCKRILKNKYLPTTTTTRPRSICSNLNNQKSVRFSNNDCSRLRDSVPIISNLPLINVNSSIVLLNNSPFGLNDPRFGILHHNSPSYSYL